MGNSNDYYQVGYIGFIDASEAAYYGLPAAKIQNAAGKYVSATPAAIHAALSHATKNPDGVTVRANFKTRDKKAYPMPIVDYATAPTDDYNGAKGATLRAFLQYAVGAGQQSLAPGYTPLPANMIAQTTRVIPDIPATYTTPTGTTGTGSSTPPPSGGISGTGPGTKPPSTSGATGPTGPASTTKHRTGPVAAMLGTNDGRLVLPALSGMSALGLLGGLALLGMGDGRRRAKAALAGVLGDLPRPRWPRWQR